MDSGDHLSLVPPVLSLESHISKLPNELITLVLQNLPRVHRVSPRLTESMNLIRSLSLVSKPIRAMAREIYYGENVVTIQRMLLPSQIFSWHISKYDCPRVQPIIRLPSSTISHLIKRLDIFITKNMNWSWFPEYYIQDILGPDRDLGILLRPHNEGTWRTEWQRNMTALEDLRIVFKVRCNSVKTMIDLFRILPRRVTCDLSPRRLEVEVELIHVQSWGWGCSYEELGTCEDVVKTGMGKMLKLRK